MPTQRILDFVIQVGLTIRERPLPETTFVPGIFIEQGALVIDRSRLAHPGDILHEAGHIAVTPSEDRALLHDNLNSGPADEMAAIAWSFAACVELGLGAEVVFHAHGYQGGGPSLAENFREGRYLGVPLLQWYGMTRERADGSGAPVYPRMSRWLR